MKAFIYKEEAYIRCIPGKNLFKSTMIHEVVNRGDIFAIRIRDSLLTIIPGTAEVEHFDLNVNITFEEELKQKQEDFIKGIELSAFQ